MCYSLQQQPPQFMRTLNAYELLIKSLTLKPARTAQKLRSGFSHAKKREAAAPLLVNACHYCHLVPQE